MTGLAFHGLEQLTALAGLAMLASWPAWLDWENIGNTMGIVGPKAGQGGQSSQGRGGQAKGRDGHDIILGGVGFFLLCQQIQGLEVQPKSSTETQNSHLLLLAAPFLVCRSVHPTLLHHHCTTAVGVIYSRRDKSRRWYWSNRMIVSRLFLMYSTA